MTDRTVRLDWQASRDALHYVIEAGSASGAADLYYASVGASTSLTAAAPAGRYYVRVRAGGTLGFSPPSNEVIIDVH